mmetsp:Transcript_11243/g.39087  ORF Transcript_11243/g.39087 Transcript_11243/m.39087 type:complete len:130 (+) Transcript_11243:68-457(+)
MAPSDRTSKLATFAAAGGAAGMAVGVIFAAATRGSKRTPARAPTADDDGEVKAAVHPHKGPRRGYFALTDLKVGDMVEDERVFYKVTGVTKAGTSLNVQTVGKNCKYGIVNKPDSKLYVDNSKKPGDEI